MTVSYTIPQIVTLKSTDDWVFDPDPYARYNIKLYLYAETLDNTVIFYDSQGNPQDPISVTSGLEIIAKNANYRKLTFSDPNSYSIYMVLSKAVYSSDTDLTCIPPSVDLSIAPLSINVNISAQTISQLSVNVAAWSAGTLDVNISAQSVGNLAVNLAAITTSANLNVNLAAQSANINVALAASSVTLDVNISSQSANINVALAASSITLTTQGNVPITIGSNTYQSVPVSIVAQQIGNINVNLAAQSVGNIAVNIASNSAGNITVSLAAIATSANLNVNLNASAITLNVNITNATITVSGSVSISGTPAVTINAGSAIIGSLNEIVSPVSVRSKIATGYQESVEYINYDGSAFFVSGSNGDSAEDYELGTSEWTITVAEPNNGSYLSHYTVGMQYAMGASPLTIAGLQSQLAAEYVASFTAVVRCAIYSDNSNKIGTLLHQSQISSFSGSNPSGTLTYFNIAAFFNEAVTLAASTKYWFVFTFNVTSLNPSSASAFVWMSQSNATTGVFISASMVNGFPPASAYSLLSNGISLSFLTANPSTTSSPIAITQPVTSAVTINGQLIFKLGLTTHTLDEIGITSFTYSIEDTTTSTYLVNNKTVNLAISGLGVVSLADTETVSAVTLNAGDNLEITISSLTWYSGALDGTAGAIDTFIDSLDGVSYVVLPLQ